ncbi:MAG: complex I NDUFA9 subunit family protein [Alphaproteobacteria bacterium]|nr:complex I NDUFA9 subunit family protein [Alphaproteobacteria bacterium]
MQDKLVTIFGGGGFLGRYVAQELLARGARVRVAERDPSNALHIKPLGGLGQTQFIAADITRPASVSRAVQGSDAVINLVGILKGDFHTIHVEGAANIAKAAADAGVAALVHISAIGADTKSPSAYGRSKGEGEAAVKAAFPAATIIRPSIIFGPEDQFINRFAKMIRMSPLVPVIGANTKFQPVYATDAGKAIALAAMEPGKYGGKTYELGGPQVMTMAEINGWVAKATGRDPGFLSIPGSVAGLIASLTGWLPCAPITTDQWKMLQSDNVVSSGTMGLGAFGIDATPLSAVAPAWLVQYRKHGRFGSRVSV